MKKKIKKPCRASTESATLLPSFPTTDILFLKFDPCNTCNLCQQPLKCLYSRLLQVNQKGCHCLKQVGGKKKSQN